MLISAKSRSGGTVPVEIASQPDRCPICHNGIDASYEIAFLGSNRLQVVYRCPFHGCSSFFIATYVYPRDHDRTMRLAQTAPHVPEKESFSDVISLLSPDFCRIYNQAKAAEELGLEQICGVGYRKALEFLVKDYAIGTNPTKAEEIRRAWLGVCIQNHVDDLRVKECAELAAWLGNDETHYVRVWTGKDLGDLKILISLTVNWIENVRLTEKYKSEMK